MDILHERKHHLAALGESQEQPGHTEIIRRRPSWRVIEAADRAHGLELPPDLRFLRRIESGPVAALFPDPDGIQTFALLHVAEGEFYLRIGNEELAQAKFSRAMELLLEVIERRPPDESCLERIFGLSQQLDATGLEDGYHAKLRRLRAH